MASGNESQGLKIAVAALVMLTVILAVSCYFLGSNYSQASAKLAEAEKKVTEKDGLHRTATEAANHFKEKAGYGSIEDFAAAKDEIEKDFEKTAAEIKQIEAETTNMITAFQRAGNQNPKLEELKLASQQLISAYLSDQNKSFKGSIDRLSKLMASQTRLATALSANYLELRQTLESANQVNAASSRVVTGARDKALNEVRDEATRHQQERQTLLERLEQFQAELQTKATDLQNLQNTMTASVDRLTRERDELRRVNRDLQDSLARRETVLDKADGLITYVDYGRGEVHVNINRRDGARPLMKLAVFDKNAPGIPNDKPKGFIELMNVGDPERGGFDSLARIVSTVNPIDPIRAKDQVYSPVWSPNDPQRFALIGPLDMNRDGRDDREDLIRMIEAAGGIVEFDLPPPSVSREPGRKAVQRGFARIGDTVPPSVGREIGRISGRATGYVTDDRVPLNTSQKVKAYQTKEEEEFAGEVSRATREARDNGVRPLPIERLLTYLGYDFRDPVVGRTEVRNRSTIKEVITPVKKAEDQPAGEAAPKADDDAPKTEQ